MLQPATKRGFRGVRWNGGRPKGAISKAKKAIEDRVRALGCDPFEIMAQVAMGKLCCGVCFGKGKAKYMRDGKISERVCESCYGTGKESVSPDTRFRAAAELAQYLGSKRRAIEISNESGNDVATSIQIAFVAAAQELRDMEDKPRYQSIEDVAEALEAGAEVKLEECSEDISRCEMPARVIDLDEDGKPILPPEFPPMEWK